MAVSVSASKAAPTPSAGGAQGLIVPFVCFFLSGASGLVFEIIWTRKLTLVFGASTPAISTVLTAFMGGLALGSYFLGRAADRLKFPILTYAAVETGVGILALLIPTIIDVVYPPISRIITNHGGNRFDVFTLLRFLVVAFVLLPPTVLMGASLPFLVKHFVRREGGMGHRVGALYAVNTFGAVAGTFIAGFILLKTVGLWRTNATAACANLFLASLIIVFRKRLLGNAWPKSWRELLPVSKAEFAADASSAQLAESHAVAEPPAESVAAAEATPARQSAKRGRRPDGAGARTQNAQKKQGATDAAPKDAASHVPSDRPAASNGAITDGIDEPTSRALRWGVGLAAAGSGFAALAYEVVLSRALDMVIGSSIYSFAIILMAFLVGIGGGSALCSAILKSRPGPLAATAIGGAFLAVGLLQMLIFRTRLSTMVFVITAIVVMISLVIAATSRRPGLALGAVQLLIGIGAACTYYFQDKVPRMFVYLAMVASDLCDESRPVRFSGHIGTIQTMSFLVAALCALPPAIGMGAAFPLSVRAYARNIRTIGSDTGAVYAINTVGSILGSFLTGFFIMPAVGMETAFYIAVTVNLAIALILLLIAPGDEPAKYVLVPIAAILLAIAGTGSVLGREGRIHRSQGRLTLFPRPWNQEMMTMGVFRLSLADSMIVRRRNQCIESEESEREHGLGGENPIFYRDGVTTTVTVERWSLGTRTHFALKNNGKVDASNGDDMPTQILVSGLPLLLHPRGPEGLNVGMVGWGSGVTVGTTMQFPIRHLDVVELERATLDASRYFAEVNHLQYTLPDFPYVSMPRLNVINNDGRNFLASTDRRYDVVISEPSNPWITGVANLFTIDNYRAASQALAPGAIYLQWVQLYEMNPNNIKTLYRTFTEVFPYVRVFAADAYSSDTIMLGSYSPIRLDVGRVDAILEGNERIRNALAPGHIRSASDLFARLLFADRDEVRRFAVVEERNDGSGWREDLRANGSGPCDPRVCRRRPSRINTDDNALIEFAAPRDLIGFDAFAGYTETMYQDDWPYGRAERQLTGLGEGEVRVRTLARLGQALLAAGRPSRAGDVLDQAAAVRNERGEPVRTPELDHAARVWQALTTQPEPALHLETPRAGPDVSREGEEALRNAFASATASVERGSIRVALATMSTLPVSVREGSGPSARMFYGYLLYRASLANDSEPRFGEAADQLEELARSEPTWAVRHPEVLYFIGRSRYRAGDYGLAVTALSSWVDMMQQPALRDHELVEVVHDIDEPPFDQPPVTDGAGESVKDLRPAM